MAIFLLNGRYVSKKSFEETPFGVLCKKNIFEIWAGTKDLPFVSKKNFSLFPKPGANSTPVNFVDYNNSIPILGTSVETLAFPRRAN